MASKRPSLFSRRKKSKISKNKTAKKQISLTPINVWHKFGSVYSPLKKKYVRLGSNESFKVLQNELPRDEEWHTRVQFMSEKNNDFGNKLKTLL